VTESKSDQLQPMPADWQRALAVVAHPDDLEYGCSAAIASWTEAGREIAYVLATRGEAGIDSVAPAECGPLREREQRASAAAVGVSVVEFLDHRDGVPELAAQGLPPWNGVRWVAVANSNNPTHAVRADRGLERAVRSLLEHRAYIEALTDEDPETHVRRFLTDSTNALSARFGGKPAVVFELFNR
jgi:LmbE family N-acetylglucosaminyl deacetylase